MFGALMAYAIHLAYGVPGSGITSFFPFIGSILGVIFECGSLSQETRAWVVGSVAAFELFGFLLTLRLL